MRNGNGKVICDAEIGSVKRGWRSCCRPAVVQSYRKLLAGYSFTDYCERHKDRATEEGREVFHQYNK